MNALVLPTSPADTPETGGLPAFADAPAMHTHAFTANPAPLAALGLALHYELRFESLFHAGRALAFPCDAQGLVELDTLSERARRNYFYARTVIGREFATPAVVPTLRD